LFNYVYINAVWEKCCFKPLGTCLSCSDMPKFSHAVWYKPVSTDWGGLGEWAREGARDSCYLPVLQTQQCSRSE
jgi:hypothetical protein